MNLIKCINCGFIEQAKQKNVCLKCGSDAFKKYEEGDVANKPFDYNKLSEEESKNVLEALLGEIPGEGTIEDFKKLLTTRIDKKIEELDKKI